MSPLIMPLLAVMLAAGCAPWRLWGEIPMPAASPGSAAVPEAPPERVERLQKQPQPKLLQ